MAYGLFSDIGAMARSAWDPGYYSDDYMDRKSQYQLAKKTLRKRHRTSRIGKRQRGRTGRTEATGKRSGEALLGGLGAIGAGIGGTIAPWGPWAEVANAMGGLTGAQVARMQAGEMPTDADYGGTSPWLLLGGVILLGGGAYMLSGGGK